MVDRIDRCSLVFFVIVIHQLYCHFGVCFGIEVIPLPCQLISELLVVFDDTIVYCHDISVIADMRMCVFLRRFSMCCPSRMTDTARALYRSSLVCLFPKCLQSALCLDHFYV